MYISAQQENIRASISELGDVYVHAALKIRPTLFNFDYFDEEVTLEMKYYRGNRTGVGQSGPVGRWKPTPPNTRYDRDKILKIDGVADVYPEKGGLRIDCDTRNPVTCRTIADEAIRIINES